MMKRGDFIMILVVLLAAGSIYGYKWYSNRNEQYAPGDLKAVITVNGKAYKTVNLTKEEQIIDIQTKFGHNILKVYDYGIQMTYSDAPLTIALDMGFISRPKQQIICIPARILVEVFNPDASIDDDDALDAVI
ncbi:NusG domain II-containing protein [Paenibacillus sp. MMS20-IR301]|uniref:NusG domain II-containing protein n=1 Tax=Paenibacillus sp. MMS20-IR301 TaxID=2895946 RepID=UPI0028EC1666|nr:NusG domain II-containing protein [Paenibacillus sp. MMS20-IR301]WNS46922.1 NusG domain II-containing protein [Paenibacillus sp. MMS20-IR301]